MFDGCVIVLRDSGENDRGFKLIMGVERACERCYRKKCVNICEIIVIRIGYIIYVYICGILVENVVQEKREFE